jgi:hypothetical protein
MSPTPLLVTEKEGERKREKELVPVPVSWRGEEREKDVNGVVWEGGG